MQISFQTMTTHHSKAMPRRLPDLIEVPPEDELMDELRLRRSLEPHSLSLRARDRQAAVEAGRCAPSTPSRVLPQGWHVTNMQDHAALAKFEAKCMQPSWVMEKDVEDLGEQPATPAGPRDSEPVEVVETDLHFAERSLGSFGMTQQQMSLLLGKRPRKEIAREVVRGWHWWRLWRASVSRSWSRTVHHTFRVSAEAGSWLRRHATCCQDASQRASHSGFCRCSNVHEAETHASGSAKQHVRRICHNCIEDELCQPLWWRT